MHIRISLLLLAMIAGMAIDAHAAGRRRALLIGINDYSASHIEPRLQGKPAPGRDWPRLRGAVTDVNMLEELLVLLYGFDRSDIVKLTDQSATRDTILRTLEQHLVRNIGRDDIVFFYYAGHGSQVRNSLSDEQDKLDETIVPADSRLGARDIRDKELRLLFNRILDRGARLTIMLDKCHSGSGARGLATGAQPRGVRPDLRDVRNHNDYGPRPENRGALVLAATEDFEAAWETRDDEGMFHGAFSWAWMRALRDSSPAEAAEETFLRAQARMRAETPYQSPIMAGESARLHPFLGVRGDRRGDRTVVAVEKIQSDGTVLLQGGWANGLTIGTELRSGDPRSAVRLVITAIRGLGRSEARLQAGRAAPQAIQPGALLEVAGWAAPPGRPLRVWAPRTAGNVHTIAALAGALATEARRRGVRWITDPIETTPTHLLRHRGSEWEILGADGSLERVGSDADVKSAIAKIPAGSSLFVQFPAPATLVDGLAIEPVEQPDNADYVLVGRFADRRLAYAWLRPLVTKSDRRKTGLPLRTDWITDDVTGLRNALRRIRRIHGWQVLESPPDSRFAYRLAVRRQRGNLVKEATPLIGDGTYELALRAPSRPPQGMQRRYVYAFVIDSYGKGILLFPLSGSVENRFPHQASPPAEIPFGEPFVVAEPYGIDTYFLLSTDEPLPNPWILQWDGVRKRDPQPLTPLEQFLMLTGSDDRAPRRPVTTPAWSLEKVAFESISPREHATKR